jgi:hypothetical protein
MSNPPTHRGLHPSDQELFAAEAWSELQSAVADLAWLLTRGYRDKSALKLVGDRYALTARQRQAVARSTCGNAERDRRLAHQVDPAALRGQVIVIDGFNLLVTLETALSGGIMLPGRDGCYRDIASMRGNYRMLAETRPALELIQAELAVLGVCQALWYFDRPVSNSGRLKTLLATIATDNQIGPPVDIQLVPNPDLMLAASSEIVVTSDSAVLDQCQRWFNLARYLISRRIPNANIIPMQGKSGAR